MANLKPLKDRLIVQQINYEQKRESGIILPAIEGSMEFFFGKVTHVGKGKIIASEAPFDPIPMDAKIGDIVMFNPRQAVEFDFLGEHYFGLRDSEIAYIVEG